DDGGHTMEQQIVTFEILFDHVRDDGVYLCEDLHTSYWPKFGGGYKREGTFIEYSKNFIDQLNAYHSKQRGLKVNKFTKNVDSIHYYDSILVLEKKERRKPYDEETGHPSFEIPAKHKKNLVDPQENPGANGLRHPKRLLWEGVKNWLYGKGKA